MLKKILNEIYTRDLNKLLSEIKLYEDEKKIWALSDGITNCAGNLILHLAGNLNHYIGAILGKSGYLRNRPNEFSLKDISKEELLKMVEETLNVVTSVIDKLNEDDFYKDFPEEVFGKKDSIGFIFIHLATHLTYHIGQINYHRRLVN